LVISSTIPARTPGDFALDEDRVSIVCRNPDLAAERTRKGGDLLAATERDLTRIKAAVGTVLNGMQADPADFRQETDTVLRLASERMKSASAKQ
jgi:virulence-associated protein VagC